MSFSESFCLVTSKLCGTNDSPDSTLRSKIMKFHMSKHVPVKVSGNKMLLLYRFHSKNRNSAGDSS